MQFAVEQDNCVRIPLEYVHIAQSLESKNLLSSLVQSRRVDVTESFYMKKEILNYLTTTYKQEIYNARTTR